MNSTDKFGNDNTLKLLGFDYQKLIALELCLNAKPNENIWIECKGDVADKETSIEVKHHESDHALISNSPDVWNTIHNYLKEASIISGFSSLLLLTTSSIPSDSIFHGWNELTPEQKRKKLIEHEPSLTVKEFHLEICNYLSTDLENILKKFSILSDQPKIKEKWEKLKQHASLVMIDEDRRDAAIELLYGLITKKAIDDSHTWHIDINDFKKDMRFELRGYVSLNTPFQIVDVSDIPSETSDQKFLFLEKMEAVRLKERDQQKAISDYLRAQESQIRMLILTPPLKESLINYDSDVERLVEDEKAAGEYNLSLENIGSDIARKESQDLYFRCINKPHDDIRNVSNTQRYYRNGRIHHVAEHSSFEWEYREEDVCK